MKRYVIEIDTFLNAYSLGGEIKESYLNLNGLGNMRDYELETLYSLFSSLSPSLSQARQKMGYLIDKSVTCGIREQFDILRFSNSLVVNIELKYKLPKDGFDGICYQLQRHEHLLKNIRDNVRTFCYVHQLNKLYCLKDSLELVEVSVNDLAETICDDYIPDNLLDSISSSSILISPYAEPRKFVTSKYFLSDEQRDVVKQLVKEDNVLNAIIGGPGTGKSLVLFELAKHYMSEGKKVLLIFSAKFEEHDFDSYFNFDFKPIKGLDFDSVSKEYDVILVDESQRLYEHQLSSLYHSKKVIFAVDHQQVLKFSEEKLGVESLLRNNGSVVKYELSNKVRSDKELASFIHHFFDLHSRVKLEEFKKINAVYFPSEQGVEDFIKSMAEHEQYVPIELSYYQKLNWNKPNEIYRKRIYDFSKNQFDVIGREYDKVLVVIDKMVRYDENGQLIVTQRNYDYIELRGLFEAITRVRERLLLVFVDNLDLFINTCNLLTKKSAESQYNYLKGLLTQSQRLEEGLIAEGNLERNDYVTSNRKIRDEFGKILKSNN